MKNLLVMCACLVALLVPNLPATAGEPSTVILRVSDGGGNVRMSLTGHNGRSEIFDFKASSINDNGLKAAGQGYYNVIDKLHKEGYELKSTFTSATHLTTLVFVKP